MAMKKFICPDGVQVDIDDCLKGCRAGCDVCPAGRCLSVRTLTAIADQRVWDGKPSTTQLLRGTRESYLLIKHDYAIDPQKSLFALHGTKAHGALDKHTPDGCLSEERLDDGISTGAFDFWSPENGGTLIDVKTYGSYAVAKTLGYKETNVPDGVYKTGERKGQTKYKKVISFDGVKKRFDLAVQLNDYRMKLEQVKGVPVKHMLCEVIVRDGGTYMATNRGITQNGYLIPINRISDHWVRLYMTKKRDDLASALATGVMPKPCNKRERWQDKYGKCNKCIGYCAVAEFCDIGIKQKELFGGR